MLSKLVIKFRRTLAQRKNLFSGDFLRTQSFAKEIRMNEDLLVRNECLISSKYSFITKCVSLCLILPASHVQCFPTIGQEGADTCKWSDRTKR
jgi:hypothetical protein